MVPTFLYCEEMFPCTVSASSDSDYIIIVRHNLKIWRLTTTFNISAKFRTKFVSIPMISLHTECQCHTPNSGGSLAIAIS
jgi:hypothetical protein